MFLLFSVCHFFSDIAEFRQSALMAHNKLRTIHGALPLKLNEKLCKEAEDYAKEIVTKKKGLLQHSPKETRKGEGENLAMSCSRNREELRGAEATFKWYLIINLFSFYV